MGSEKLVFPFWPLFIVSECGGKFALESMSLFYLKYKNDVTYWLLSLLDGPLIIIKPATKDILDKEFRPIIVAAKQIFPSACNFPEASIPPPLFSLLCSLPLTFPPPPRRSRRKKDAAILADHKFAGKREKEKRKKPLGLRPRFLSGLWYCSVRKIRLAMEKRHTHTGYPRKTPFRNHPILL